MPTDIIANKYKIVREIARSNDVVYEAVDVAMGRRLAIKELSLPPNLTGQARRERIERFQREARAAGKLSHPNIVTVYEAPEFEGRHYIVMEYLEGTTLRDALQARGALPVREAVDIACQILGALSHAHARRVIHRDVKPDNISLTHGGVAKLTDFGIARLTEEASLTGDGQVFGTPSFMSPEQIEGKFVDHRTDLFSLGIVLYEMLAGRKPFTGDSVISITHAIMTAEPPPLQGIPFPLEQAIFKALSKNPGMRYNSADEMRMALQQAEHSPMHAPRQPTYLGGHSGMTNLPGPAPLYAPSTGYAPPPMPSAYGTPAYAPAGAPSMLGGPPTGLPATVYAPPPQAAAPTNSGAGPFVNWGGNPNNPAAPPGYAPPPPPFPRQNDGPLLSEGTKTFFSVLFWTMLISGALVGIVLLFIRAYDENQKRVPLQQAEAVIDAGVKLYKSGDVQGAIQKFEEALKLTPSGTQPNSDARTNLAVAYNKLGQQAYDVKRDSATAEKYFYRALDYDPNNEQAHQNLADLYDRTGQHDKAMEEWRQSSDPGRVGGANPAANGSNSVIQAQKQQAQNLYEQGIHAYQQGNLDKARDYWQQAVGAAPGSEAANAAQRELDRTTAAPNF